jgi:phage tail sheath protein FI
MCESYLDQLSAKGAFQTETGDKGYLVVCDTTNNTPQTIDANELHVDIFLKPSRAAEYIQLQTIITTTGASFTELVARGINL